MNNSAFFIAFFTLCCVLAFLVIVSIVQNSIAATERRANDVWLKESLKELADHLSQRVPDTPITNKLMVGRVNADGTTETFGAAPDTPVPPRLARVLASAMTESEQERIHPERPSRLQRMNEAATKALKK